MAKFSRFLLGGAIGAGLAFLLSRKDVRRRLMGGGQAQLPAAHEPAMGAANGSATTSLDLESRIEESKRQVEASLEEPFAKTVADEKNTEIIEAVIGEPAVAAPGEFVSGETAETVAGEMLPGEEEQPADFVVQEEAATPQEAPKSARVTPDQPEAAEPASEEGEFTALSTPAEGEPAMGGTGAEADGTPEPSAKPEPTRLDRDEMKKRIDETRARLKAKAFDAMISGETFVTPDTGEPIKAREPGVDIDEETGDQINHSLKEQD